MRSFCLPLSICFLGFVATLSAHETWLLPTAFSIQVGQEAVVDLTSGMKFPEPDHAIRQDRVAQARLRLGTDKAAVKDIKPLDKSLRLTPSLPRPGLATVWIELHPRTIELADEKVGEYLDEIGATDEVRAAWARLKGRGAWKETYTKYAKTFLAVGDARADRSWREPVGMGLELVPVADPQELRIGRKATFALLAKGKPLVAAPVGLLVEGTADRVFQKTDAEGRVSFPLDKASKVLVYAVHLRLAKDGATWESDFTTLTLRALDK